MPVPVPVVVELEKSAEGESMVAMKDWIRKEGCGSYWLSAKMGDLFPYPNLWNKV